MARLVWKRLRPEELADFRERLDALTPKERPVYGLIGVEASWWTRLGGPARPFVVLFRGDRVILYKRSWRGHHAVSRRQFKSDDLQRVKVRRGPLLESARLWFADGYSVRVGSLPRHQSGPVELFLAEGPAAFEPSRLTPEQLTNTRLAWEALGLPAGAGQLPGGCPPDPGGRH
ncbi:MAG: hypothetical protein H6Q11_1321 [Acidobacteria bacterium]|nr:hypothetical protein [Acidobacteriota bacterium]